MHKNRLGRRFLRAIYNKGRKFRSGRDAYFAGEKRLLGFFALFFTAPGRRAGEKTARAKTKRKKRKEKETTERGEGSCIFACQNASLQDFFARNRSANNHFCGKRRRISAAGPSKNIQNLPENRSVFTKRASHIRQMRQNVIKIPNQQKKSAFSLDKLHVL